MAPPKQPGVFESIGRWFDEGASNFRDHLRGAKRKMDDLSDDAAANSKGFSENAAKVGQGAADVGKGAADATKNAMDAVAKLPTARLMSGRERCAIAPNGAPDCVAAAEALCRKHGFTSGKSMDFTSAEECPVKTVLGQTQRMHDRDLHQPRDVPIAHAASATALRSRAINTPSAEKPIRADRLSRAAGAPLLGLAAARLQRGQA